MSKSIREQVIEKIPKINLAYGTNISALIVYEDEWQRELFCLFPIHDSIDEDGILLLLIKDTERNLFLCYSVSFCG